MAIYYFGNVKQEKDFRLFNYRSNNKKNLVAMRLLEELIMQGKKNVFTKSLKYSLSKRVFAFLVFCSITICGFSFDSSFKVRADNNFVAARGEYKGHLYELYDNSLTWTEAKTACEEHGGHLLTITSEEEQKYIESLMEGGRKRQYWMGLHLIDNKMEWVTGEKLSYSNWDKGEPNHCSRSDGQKEDFIHIYNIANPAVRGSKRFCWNDMYNDNTFPNEENNFSLQHVGYICEYEQPKLYAMILNGISGEESFGADNDAAMMYTRLCDNKLNDYMVEAENIHPFSYNNSSSPTTQERVEQWISWSFSNTNDRDLSIFFYTGHSTWNGSSASNYGITLGNGVWYNWIDLARFLSEHIRGDIVVIMDACFSNNFITEGVNHLAAEDQARFSVLASCAANEESSTKNVTLFHKLFYGCFSYSIGQGIGFVDNKLYADTNNDNRITIGELYDYVRSKVKKYNKDMNVQLLTRNRNQVIFEYGLENNDDNVEQEGYVQFTDVPNSSYYASAVNWAAECDITTGINQDIFGPSLTVTRGQAVTFLWRAMGEPEPNYIRDNPFSDVNISDYFYKAILWAVEQGITNGVSETQFAPNDNLTRAHIITFLWRNEGMPQKHNVASEWYEDAVYWAEAEGLTSGTSTPFSTDNQNYCPRSDTVYYLWKLFACS